jgi:hypothetical protein
MSKSLRRKLIALSTVGCLGLAGCYGQFALTRKIYNWNGSVTSNRFVNSAILFALIVIPVYELVTLGDYLIFNTIEFYSGSNPVAMNQDGSVDTRYADHAYHLQRLADGRVEVTIDGKPSYRYREAGENLVLEDLNGKIMRVVPARAHMDATQSTGGTL